MERKAKHQASPKGDFRRVALPLGQKPKTRHGPEMMEKDEGGKSVDGVEPGIKNKNRRIGAGGLGVRQIGRAELGIRIPQWKEALV